MENLLPQKKKQEKQIYQGKGIKVRKEKRHPRNPQIKKHIKTFFLQAREIILSCIKVSNVPEESRKHKKFKNHQTEWGTHSKFIDLIGARASVLHSGWRHLFHKWHNWDRTNRRLFFNEICLPDRRDITDAAFYAMRSYSATLPRKIILNE